MCCVSMWMMRRTWGVPVISACSRSMVSGVADSPMSELFISVATTMATTISTTPMPSVPMASQTGSPVDADRLTPSTANTRPTSAARSSTSSTGSSGLRDSRM